MKIIEDLQTEVGVWADKTFPMSTPESIIEHLKDEVIELLTDGDPMEAADCFILLLQLAYKRGFDLLDVKVTPAEYPIMTNPNYFLINIQTFVGNICADSSPELLAEAAHILFMYCHYKNVDIMMLAEEKHEINKNRKWGAPDKRGVVKHIE